MFGSRNEAPAKYVDPALFYFPQPGPSLAFIFPHGTLLLSLSLFLSLLLSRVGQLARRRAVCR